MKPPRPIKKYNLLGSSSHISIIYGGRGSGKSFEIGRYNCLLSFEPNQGILFTRYTLSSAKDSIIPEFQEKIEFLGLSDLFETVGNDIVNAQSKSFIKFRGIKTGSGDQTAKLKSLNGITTWVIEEAEELTDEALFDKIAYSIRKKGVQNRIIIVLNPATKAHWIYKRFFEDNGVEDGYTGIKNGITYIHSTYLDNINNLSPSFIADCERLKISNPAKFNHIILGGWLDKAEGVIFKNWRYGEFDNNLPFGFGLDFGFFPDPDVLVRCAIDRKNMKLYVSECFRLNEQSPQSLIENITKEVGNNIVVADSAEKRLISFARNSMLKTVPVSKGAGSIENGIRLMQDFEIIIDPKSTKLGTEFNNYCTKNGIPIDDYNHGIDAIRYYVMTTYQQRKKQGVTILGK